MEKRYQVFISSTFQDLQNARQEVSQALLRADCFPAGMELFPAADEEQFEFIKTIIDQSDYYIIISAGRYGSIHPETGLSYTEMEYDYAVASGKPVIRLLHRDPLQLLAGGLIEKSEVGRKRLEAFRQKLMGSNLVSFWESQHELGMQATMGLMNAIRRYEATGWVKLEKKAAASISLRKKNELSETEIDELIRDQIIKYTDDYMERISEIERAILAIPPTIEIRAIEKIVGIPFLDQILTRTLYSSSTGVKLAMRLIGTARAPVEKEVLLQSISREFFGRYGGRFAKVLMASETSMIFDSVVLPLLESGVLERRIEVAGQIDSELTARELFVISEATYVWLQKKLNEGPLTQKRLPPKTQPQSAP